MAAPTKWSPIIMRLSGHVAALGLLAGVLSGCLGVTDRPQPTQQRADGITYGMVKRQIQRGETTQAEVLRLFGSPNNLTKEDDSELWIYDVTSTEAYTVGSHERVGGAIGGGGVVGAGGIGGFATGSTGTSVTSYSTSTRTLTVIIEFDPKGVVKDYSARSARY